MGRSLADGKVTVRWKRHCQMERGAACRPPLRGSAPHVTPPSGAFDVGRSGAVLRRERPTLTRYWQTSGILIMPTWVGDPRAVTTPAEWQSSNVGSLGVPQNMVFRVVENWQQTTTARQTGSHTRWFLLDQCVGEIIKMSGQPPCDSLRTCPDHTGSSE